MASFTEVFGGNVLYPSGQTYLSLTFSVDQQLQWPVEQQIAGGNPVSSIMDLSATVPGLNVDFPDATQVSNGIQSVFNNIGAETVTIRDNSGGTIISLAPGTAWVVYLADNSTSAGTWRTFQLGASVSVAAAAALAGAGLKAITTTLNQTMPPTLTAITPVNLVNADRAQLTVWTGGVGIANLPDPGTVGSDWFTIIRNNGSGDLTLTPASGMIDSLVTIDLAPGQSAFVVTDGTNWFTVGLGVVPANFFDFIEINVAGSGDYALSGLELNRIAYRFTGVLSNDRTIIVPSTVQQYWVDNSTTGAFQLFVKTSTQVSPVEVLQAGRAILYCDGTNVVDADTADFAIPLPIALGGTAATTAADARTNLGVPPETRNLTAGTGLTGGGDLSADRTFDLDAASPLNVDHATVILSAGVGIDGAGLGDITVSRTIALDTGSPLNVDHSAVVLSAGLGMDGAGLGDLTVSRTIAALAAAEGQEGVLQIATQTETNTGTNDTKAITPLKLANFSGLGGTFRGCKVFSSVTQAISTGSGGEVVTWNSEAFDTDSFHDTVTNNSRITIPNGSGITLVKLSCCLAWETNSGSYRAILFRKNGANGPIDDNQTTFQPRISQVASLDIQTWHMCGETGIIAVDELDFFEILAVQQFGADVDIIANQSWFQLEVVE